MLKLSVIYMLLKMTNWGNLLVFNVLSYLDLEVSVMLDFRVFPLR